MAAILNLRGSEPPRMFVDGALDLVAVSLLVNAVQASGFEVGSPMMVTGAHLVSQLAVWLLDWRGNMAYLPDLIAVAAAMAGTGGEMRAVLGVTAAHMVIHLVTKAASNAIGF